MARNVFPVHFQYLFSIIFYFSDFFGYFLLFFSKKKCHFGATLGESGTKASLKWHLQVRLLVPLLQNCHSYLLLTKGIEFKVSLGCATFVKVSLKLSLVGATLVTLSVPLW